MIFRTNIYVSLLKKKYISEIVNSDKYGPSVYTNTGKEIMDRYLVTYYTITALERDQYCCTLLHKTSYWSSSSVVIILLHYFNIFWKFWNHMKFYENFDFFFIILNFFFNFWNFNFFYHFEIFWKFWNFMKFLIVEILW
jgi:hypothetical protein